MRDPGALSLLNPEKEQRKLSTLKFKISEKSILIYKSSQSCRVISRPFYSMARTRLAFIHGSPNDERCGVIKEKKSYPKVYKNPMEFLTNPMS